jgi:molybdate transport system regulatory protein
LAFPGPPDRMLGRVTASKVDKKDRIVPCQSRKLVVKVKTWIEDEDGQMVFGPGRISILEAVDRGGSILAAAKELGMSYRAVWGKIKTSEECLGQPLVRKHIGGPHGGGSELTGFGKALVECFRQLQTVTRTTSDALFRGLFMDRMGGRLGDSSDDRK